MKITGERDNIAKAVEVAGRAVSARVTVPVLECLLLVADERGFRVIGNDLEMGIETEAVEGVEVEEEGKVALDAKMFGDIIRKLPSTGKVLFRTDEGNVATIRCQKTEFKILGQGAEEFPYLPTVERNNYYMLPSVKLKDMIRQTIFATAVDESKPVMTGELVEASGGEIKIIATDGFRMAFRRAEGKSGEGSEGETLKAIIPAKALNEVQRLLPQDEDEDVGVYVSERYALFEMRGCVLVTRLLHGDFINYERIFAAENTTIAKVDRALLLDCVERALLMSRDVRKNPVKFNFGDERVVITSFTEMGNFYDEIDAIIDGNDIELLFNPKYIVDVLKAIDGDEITIQMTTPLSPCFFRSETDNTLDYLVLPLRSRS